MNNLVNVKVGGVQDVIRALQNYNTIILKPNIVDNRNVLTQEMMNEKHTKYVIKWNYILEGGTVTVPEDCIIEFAGGTIDNGVIIGNNTRLIYSKPIDEICKAERQGTWIHDTTVADEEDITSVEGHLKFKDRPATDGMGKVILRKNKSFASQVTKPNTIYVIQYDFVLNSDVTIPENCVLEFDGGSISGGHTLNLSDNNSLIGNNTIIKAVFDSNTCTSNTMLNINNINNIHIEGIIFDGDYDGSAAASGDYSGHALIKISSSENVVFRNCKIQNWHQSWKSGGEFHVVIAENSSNITFDGITLYNIRPDAPVFQYCSNVIVTNYNTTVNSFWTGLHFFYCNNVILSKSYIQIPQAQGSTVNCTAKHVVIEDCVFIGGQGLDFSNEGGDQTFDSEDIVVRNCSISNENGYGLYTTPTPHTVKNILIDGCKCITKSFASLQSTFGFTVRNCDVTVTGSSDTFVAASKKEGEKYGDYLIENNRITAARILGAPTQDYDEGISFINNSITVSQFIIYISGTYSYKKILFVSNEVYANNGSDFIYVSNGTLKAEQFVIDKNLFKGNINIRLPGDVNQGIVTNNIFSSMVTVTNDAIIKNNLWSASETSYTALNFEYGNLNNCTIIDNNLGSNGIDFRVTTIGNNFVFNNNIYGSIANYSGKANLLQILDTHKNLNRIVNSGITALRPTENLYIGYCYFDTSLNPARPIYWNGSAWVDATGVIAGTPTSGTFANKPTVSANNIPIGFKYFCTDKQTTEGATDGIEIIHKGNDMWVDALGRAVS